MAQCLLHHGWLVLLKTGACCGLPIFFEVTTNWRAGCQKLACPVRREGRPESSSLPLSCHACRHARPAHTPFRISPYADTPTRPYADTFLPHADTPFRFSTPPTVAGEAQNNSCNNATGLGKRVLTFVT